MAKMILDFLFLMVIFDQLGPLVAHLPQFELIQIQAFKLINVFSLTQN